MKHSAFLLVASSLAVSQAAVVQRGTPLTEGNLEKRQNQFRGGPCQTVCNTWYTALDGCQVQAGGNLTALATCLCQPQARSAIPACLACADDDSDDDQDDDNNSVDVQDLDDLDEIDDLDDLEEALEDVEGVCRELGVGGNLASSASAIASSSGATLARSSSSESLTSTTIVSPMTVDNPSQPTQQIVSSVTQAVQTQARSGAGHVAASVGAFGVAAGAAFALAGL